SAPLPSCPTRRSSDLDYIQLPCVQQFSSTGGYYATALHELIHWSGHARRLNRAGIVLPTPFGSPEYAFEELIAEIGAAYLCALRSEEHTSELQSRFDL